MCHEAPEGLHSRYQRIVAFKRRYKADVNLCPMRTRRAPEMANHAMLSLLRKLLHQGSQLLLLFPSVGALPEHDRGRVMRDFGREEAIFAHDV